MNRAENERLQEIDVGERWLGDRLEKGFAPDLNQLKRRVRLAVHEEWLATRLTDSAPEGLSEAIKRSLAASLRSPSRTRGRRSADWYARWVLPIGAAAACVALVWTSWHVVQSPPSVSAMAAFFGYEEDEWTASLAYLTDEVGELELAYQLEGFPGSPAGHDEEWYEEFSGTSETIGESFEERERL